MSTRQLVSPSRPSPSEQGAIFRLQPPPHRYKENRRCRVLSGKANQSQCSTLEEEHPLLATLDRRTHKDGQGPSLQASPAILGGVDDSEEEDDASTIHGDDESMYERPKRLLSGDVRLVYPKPHYIDPSEYGSILTSPVKSDIRNSAFFRDLSHSQEELWEASASGSETTVCSSSTSSFSGIAGSTFGAVRRRSSQQSVFSPKQASQISPLGEHTIVALCPLSPLTPRKSAALHTPTQAHFDGARVNTHLVLPSTKDESEPLSATLKRLGAVRKSMSLGEEEEALTMCTVTRQQLSPCREQSLAGRLESQKRAEEVMAANKQALQQSQGLFTQRAGEGKDEDKDTVLNEANERLSWLRHSRTRSKPAYSRIQSTTRGGHQQPVLRSTVNRMSTILASYIFGNTRRAGDKAETASIPLGTIGERSLPRPSPLAIRGKGDGWGGLRPRTSWFPDVVIGPLISPRATAPTLLRPLRLQSSAGVDDESAWVDEEEPEKDCRPPTDAANEPIQKLRVNFPSYLPKPSRDRRYRLSEGTAASDADESVFVRYSRTSAEGRPSTTCWPASLRRSLRLNSGLFLAFLLLVSITAVVVIITTSVIGRPLQNSSSAAPSRNITRRAALGSLYTAPMPLLLLQTATSAD